MTKGMYERTTDIKRKNSESNMGKRHGPMSEEQKKKLSILKTGKSVRPFSEEGRRNMSDGKRGKGLSEYHCRRISEGKMGKKRPDVGIRNKRLRKKDMPIWQCLLLRWYWRFLRLWRIR